MTKKKSWLYGDTKKDTKGRPIYFIGYSDDVSKKGYSIELWQPKNQFFKARDFKSN
jgi:hypothetical protein|tara:strand:- start:336 stop:503 length:168 start_codon:yes stop_codon:yes gene_type:complete